MLASIFGSIKQVFVFCFGTLNTVWSAIGSVRWLFIGIFIMFSIYRFLLLPILGRQSIILPSGWNVDRPEEPKERYQNTGIGFTARW